MMQRVGVLSIQRISAEDRAKIEAIDPAIQLIDAGGWFDGEISRDLAGLQLRHAIWRQVQRAQEPARNAIVCSPKRK